MSESNSSKEQIFRSTLMELLGELKERVKSLEAKNKSLEKLEVRVAAIEEKLESETEE